MTYVTKTSLLFLGILAIVALVVVAVVVFLLKEQPWPLIQNGLQEPLPATLPPTDLTANWETYRNAEFGFQYKYPSDWVHEKTILKGIGPPTFQMYPEGNPKLIIYTSIEDTAADLANLKKQKEDLSFHGKIEESSLRGLNGLSEVFTREQYKISGGGYWTAKTVLVNYKENRLLVLKLNLDGTASKEDESLGRDTLEKIIETVSFF